MFDPRPELCDHPPPFTTLPEERVSGGYNGWGSASSFGLKPGKTVQNYDSYRNWNGGGVQFRLETMEEESGVCSPPLWRTDIPVHSQNPHNDFRHLSPTSRTQAIARGQWELMEMVKTMPESSYELSLKDLVEQQPSPSVEEDHESIWEEERSILGNEKILSQRWKAIKRQESKKKGKVMRSGSFDYQNKGLFLNMVFPFSFGSKRKKNSHVTNSKVSPKPEFSDNSFTKYGERDWWRKRFSASGESTENGGNSTSSGSSHRSNSGRKNNGCAPGCWTFFHSKKSKSAK